MARNVLISGGSKGIGREITLRFASLGYNVFFCFNKSKAKADELCSLLSSFPIMYKAYKCDLNNESDINFMVQDILSNYGSIDILINNSGVSKIALITETTCRDYDEIMNVNVKAAFILSCLCAKGMVRNKWGKIINISSIWGERGSSMEAAYSASKHALNGLTKSLAKELAPSNINVNAVAPGVIDTDMLDMLGESTKTMLTQEIPLARLGSVSDVADLVEFLASDKANYITGQIITIDGGLS